MEIHYIKKDALEYVVIDDYYNKEELESIYEEVKSLQSKAKSPEDTGASHTISNKEYLKKGKGIFLYEHYNNKVEESAILKAKVRLFDERLYEVLERFNCFYMHLRYSTFDSILLNYYANDDEYKAHTDNSTLSAITMLKLGNIEGGDLYFPTYDELIEFKENRLVLFPGCLLHHAKKTIADEGSYRISIAHFIGYKV